MRKHQLLFFVFFLFATAINGQSYDVITFETNVTIPSSKTYSSATPVNLSGTSWTMPGVYLGTPDANDFKLGNQSARFRRLNDATGANGYMEMQQDQVLGFEYFGFWAAMYGSDTGGRLAIHYSTTQGNNWLLLDTFNIAPNATPTLYESHAHIWGNVRFRITKVDNSSSRINIDSVYCISLGAPPADLAMGPMFPQGRVHPSSITDQLILKFNQHIEAGTSGSLRLFDLTNNTTQTYSFQSPDLSINEDSLIISNVVFTPEHYYYVMLDSTLVKAEYNGDLSTGIYNNNTWKFNVTLPHLTSVNESFDTCNQWDLLGIFQQYSLSGDERWHCAEDNNNKYIAMSGNSGNKAIANSDWLVSYLKFDFNGVAPTLKFSERKTGNGTNVVRKLKYTTNFYVNISTTAWNDLLTFPNDFTNNNWKEYSTTLNQSTILNQQVNLAIHYENGNDNNAASAWEWAIDDLRIYTSDTATSLTDIKNIVPSIAILYPTTRNRIDFDLFSNENLANIAFVIYNVNGKKLVTEANNVYRGMRRYSIDGLAMLPGIYVLSLRTAQGTLNKKFVVY